MQEVKALILSKSNYKRYITIIGAFTNLLFCIFTLLPPYLLKKPNFYIYEKNEASNTTFLLSNKSLEFSQKYCDTSKYIMEKDSINSLNNWAYEYDLYCTEEKDYSNALLVISLFTGGVLGNIIFETIPDKYGREKIYKALSIIELFLQINLILDFGLFHLTIILFFIGINLYTFPLSYVVIEEFIVDDQGFIFGIINGIYPIGGILVALWYMSVNNTKLLFTIICCGLVIFNYYLFKFFYESPRWLRSKGRKKECLEVLNNIAKYNNMEQEWLNFQKNNPDIMARISPNNDEENNNNGNNNTNKYGFLEILKIESQRKKFLYTLLVWTLTGTCFYGIILYLDQMKGDFFLNAILSFVGEALAEYYGASLTDKYGRKMITVFLMYLGTFFFFLYEILPEKFSGITLFFSMMGFAGNFTCLSILINEIFVTEIRGTVYSDLYILDRFVPIIIKIMGLFCSKRVIDILFILSGLFSGVITHVYFWETLGQPHYDFIYEEEANNQNNNDIRLNFLEHN